MLKPMGDTLTQTNTWKNEADQGEPGPGWQVDEFSQSKSGGQVAWSSGAWDKASGLRTVQILGSHRNGHMGPRLW